jgi:mannosyltransferase OCH1-like enzyme
LRLVWQYTELGAFGPAIKAGVRCLLKRQSFKGIYLEVLSKIEPFLIQKYSPKDQEFKKFNSSRELKHEHPKVIWWCWLQGIENAPSIVKACFNSLRQLTGYSLVVIDNANWNEYIF